MDRLSNNNTCWNAGRFNVNLNLYSAFSIRRDQMPKLKKALQKAVFDVLDEYQDDNGDCVEQIFLSSFRTPLEIQQ